MLRIVCGIWRPCICVNQFDGFHVVIMTNCLWEKELLTSSIMLIIFFIAIWCSWPSLQSSIACSVCRKCAVRTIFFCRLTFCIFWTVPALCYIFSACFVSWCFFKLQSLNTRIVSREIRHIGFILNLMKRSFQSVSPEMCDTRFSLSVSLVLPFCGYITPKIAYHSTSLQSMWKICHR
jgi:hypothetical protein